MTLQTVEQMMTMLTFLYNASSSDDDDNDDNDDSDYSDDDNDDKPVTMAKNILLKAKECLQHLPQADLFKYSNRNSKPATSTSSEAAPVNVHAGHLCLTCGRVCKTKGGLTQHQTTHK